MISAMPVQWSAPPVELSGQLGAGTVVMWVDYKLVDVEIMMIIQEFSMYLKCGWMENSCIIIINLDSLKNSSVFRMHTRYNIRPTPAGTAAK